VAPKLLDGPTEHDVKAVVMDIAVVQEWIRQDNQKIDSLSARANSDAKAWEAAELRITTEGPEYWKQLRKDLTITASACSLLGVEASVADISNEQEEGCQVSVVNQSIFRQQTYTNVFYREGDSVIRCWSLHEDAAFNLVFCLDQRNSLAVFKTPTGKPMKTEQAAQAIVQPMVKHVKGSSVPTLA
jgi:hypothetical protein